jgi:hypothetical protein
LAAAAVVLAVAALWFLRLPAKRRRGPAILAPHLEAFRSLESLGKSRIVAEGRVDHYFTELSRILRRYVTNRYLLPALELPRHQILIGLQAQGLRPRLQHLLNALLIRADLVKFAQVKVDFSRIAAAQRRARKFIEKTQPLPEANRRV